MRYFSTPDAPCEAACPACTLDAPGETWEGWSELDPATLEGAKPTHCAHCGVLLPV